MGLHWTDWPDEILGTLRRGVAIPASPLVLDAKRQFDARRQRALMRYYVDAGAGGVAVGVHTTQFKIRDVGLYEPVLTQGANTIEDWTDRPMVRIAGLVGQTKQALREAATARDLGYHAGLLSLSVWRGSSEDDIIAHCRTVAKEIPLMGFYLQPSVGGVVLTPSFWQHFAEIENVVAIKIAPFNRYRTLDVIRGVIRARAEGRIALYTGNDDHIVGDLVIPFTFMRDGEPVEVRIVGGMLGHWSVWVRSAVELLDRCRSAAQTNVVPTNLLALASQVTDCNSALFDVANNFGGCIAGCHEVLRRQGLLEGIWCLDPTESLGPGQAREIDRIYAAYPHLNDDDFVAENRARWLDA